MRDATTLLAAAGRLLDANENGLAVAASDAARTGFRGGAEWMRRALTLLRGQEPRGGVPFNRLGVAKYSLAALPAAAIVAVASQTTWGLLPLAVVLFYVVEVRMVFAFPLALDGSERALRDSHAMVSRVMPSPLATVRVMRIAAEMLGGGLLGRGFLRSWCAGCLAVLLWYEDARGVLVRA